MDNATTCACSLKSKMNIKYTSISDIHLQILYQSSKSKDKLKQVKEFIKNTPKYYNWRINNIKKKFKKIELRKL